MERVKSRGQNVEEQISKLKKDFFEEIDRLDCLKTLDPQKINEFADRLGGIIHADIATSQLRKVYGEIKRLQRSATFEAKKLAVLTPRLAYAASRKPELQHIYDLFKKCEPKIAKREDLDRFVYILEALIAYHKYYEQKGNMKGEKREFG